MKKIKLLILRKEKQLLQPQDYVRGEHPFDVVYSFLYLAPVINDKEGK